MGFAAKARMDFVRSDVAFFITLECLAGKPKKIFAAAREPHKTVRVRLHTQPPSAIPRRRVASLRPSRRRGSLLRET